MKKNRTILLGVIIICLAFGLGLSWRWIQNSPYYSLYQIGAALKNRDTNSLLIYVDLESILNQQMPGTLSTLLPSFKLPSALGNISGTLAGLNIKLSPEMNKGLQSLISQNLREYLENPKNPTLSSSFLLLSGAKVKINGDNALVALQHEKDQLRLGMKNQEGIWRIVDLNSEDIRRLLATYPLK